MGLREILGGVAATTLASDLNSGVFTASLTDGSNFPDGSTAPFAIVIDEGTASEEVILVQSRSTNTLTIVASTGRGFSNTSDVNHTTGATVRHIVDAVMLQEINTHVHSATGADDWVTSRKIAAGALDDIAHFDSAIQPVQVVADDAAVAAIGSPAEGMVAWSSSENRLWAYDGSDWVIVGGKLPQISTQRLTNQSIDHGTSTQLTVLGAEVIDDGGFGPTSENFVVPSGMGGDYLLDGHCEFVADATGARRFHASIGSNTGVTNEIDTVGATAMAHPTLETWLSFSKKVRLEAGATVGFYVHQSSGSALSVDEWSGSLTMLQHIPSLT